MLGPHTQGRTWCSEALGLDFPRTFRLGPLVKSLVPFVDGEEAQGR